jgi:hypothetical protein
MNIEGNLTLGSAGSRRALILLAVFFLIAIT